MSEHDDLWLVPPPSLALSFHDVHTWRASLDRPESSVEAMQRTLTADESARANRFHHQRDRRRYVVARGILRAILGRYLAMEPHQLRFSYNDFGKPALSQESKIEDIQFNLSHTDGTALYAVTYGRRIGVDIESVRPIVESEQIAEQFFSSAEVADLCKIREEVKDRAFFNCWTRKEAYIKAKGEGISLPLNQFSVSMSPEEPAAITSIKGTGDEPSRWSLRDLNVGSGYAAALAVEGRIADLRCWQWPEEWIA